MTFSIVWTNKRSEARRNEYSGGCRHCLAPVQPQDGYLVSRADSANMPTANGSIHADCPLPANWYFRAMNNREMGLEAVKLAPDVEFNPVVASVPEPAELKAAKEPTEAELKQAAQEIVEAVTDKFLGQVPDLVRQTLLELTRTVEIKLPKVPAVKVKNAHQILPDIVMMVAAGVAPFLVGPAGSGKTTLASQTADVLKLKFYAENRVTSEYKLIGFMDATGKYVRTQFRDAFEKGGLFLLDEVDASDPDVLTALNSALANDFFPFPDKMVKRHPDFKAIAAGNTYGRGADREYVGRNQLDAATLDRFVVVDVDYDESAEMAWATNEDWTLHVQQVRKAVAAEKIRLIVSPRASINGSLLLAAGMEWKLVEDRCIYKGLDNVNRARVTARLGGSL